MQSHETLPNLVHEDCPSVLAAIERTKAAAQLERSALSALPVDENNIFSSYQARLRQSGPCQRSTTSIDDRLTSEVRLLFCPCEGQRLHTGNMAWHEFAHNFSRIFID